MRHITSFHFFFFTKKNTFHISYEGWFNLLCTAVTSISAVLSYWYHTFPMTQPAPDNKQDCVGGWHMFLTISCISKNIRTTQGPSERCVWFSPLLRRVDKKSNHVIKKKRNQPTKRQKKTLEQETIKGKAVVDKGQNLFSSTSVSDWFNIGMQRGQLANIIIIKLLVN